MAQPFLRIELANQARDFQNTVIEAGWPLIDKANANYQILRKWLGAAVAEPERKGEEVIFYLRNESGARIDQPDVLKITDKDLMGPLKGEFQGLVKTLQSAEPKNSSEKTLHAKALQELQSLASEKRSGDRRCCLFKYRDEKKKWHLVWAPGYRRKDEQAAKPIICTNPACSLLFLQRQDTTDKCPRCQKKPGPQRVVAGGVPRSRMPLILALLLLVALLGGAGWWYMNREPGEPEAPPEPVFAVSPESATITQDGQIEYTATFKDAEGNETDVTKKVSVVVRSKEEENTKANFAKVPVKYDIFHNKAQAKGVGTAELEFFYFDEAKKKYSTKATLVVKPPSNPKVVTIEPATVTLGIGTTAQLKMMGEYEDGHKEDLTNAADWNWEDPGQNGPVFAYKGAVQGMSKGTTKLKARYRATDDSEYVIAEADVEVADFQYTSLKLALASEKVAIGQDPGVTVEAVTADGKSMSVLGSALLKLEVEPKELADVQKQSPYLYPLKSGDGTLRATFRGITKEVPFVVGEGDPASQNLAFEVHPQNLKLAVGEIADVELPGGQTASTRFSSSDLNTVEISPHNRLIGKTPGNATVTVTQGDQSSTVKVEVAAVPFKGIDFDPSQISVRVDDVVALRIMARIDDDTQVELDPQLLEWVRFPTDDYLEVNRDPLDIRGLQPTGDDHKTLVVRLNEHEATAKIRVIPGPLTLALEPSEPIELPQGQAQELKVIATYGNGHQEEIPASRVKWNAEVVNGLTLSDGTVTAEQPDAGPLMVSVSFQGQTSNEVEIRTTHPAPVRLALTANPAFLAVGETGTLLLTAKTPGGQDVSLDRSGVKFESGDSSLVEVHPTTGGFRALGEGTVTVSATHPSSREPVSAEIRVTAAPSTAPAKPRSVRILTDSTQPIRLPVGVAFPDFRVEADVNGETRDVTAESLITVEGDPASATIALRDDGIVGIRPGEGTVVAEYAGQKSENKLTFNVTETLEVDAIQVGPPNVSLRVAETTRLDAVGFLQGEPIGIITNHPDVVWASQNPEIAKAEGPTVAGIAQGTTGVTATFKDVTSDSAEIRVIGDNTPLTDRLRVNPGAITLRPGASVAIGRGVKVFRGDAEFSQQAAVAPANSEIVSYNEDTHTLKAGLPGTTRVTFAVADQTADLVVTVLADAAPTTGGRVVIEPGSGTIAVAERLPLQVYLITADGERVNMTASAVLTSSNNDLAVPEGAGIRGIAPGRVTVSARIPGDVTPGTAVFNVENIDFNRLVVTPSSWSLYVGESISWTIYVDGPGGRRILGNDPNLTQTYYRETGVVEDWGASARNSLPAQSAGNKRLVVKWKNLEATVPVVVHDNAISALVIRPPDARIGVGDTLDYLVFARRGGRLVPVSSVDGVRLSVGNSVVASQPGSMRVRGETEGTTEVVAQLGNQQARARLRVGPRTTPIVPPSRPVALRIRPDTFQLELGTPGAPVRVVRLNSDGSTDEVAHLAEITASPTGIVEIQDTPSGPVMTPKSIGQTQIHAKLGDLQTQTPMLVDVTDELPGRARVVVRPNTVRVNVGQRETLSRVAVIPARGGSAIELPYKITATPNNFFAIENDQVIRGLAEGQALANVTIDSPNSKYDGQSNTVIVQVSDPATHRILTNESDLELRGPTVTSEGTEVAYRVDLVDGASGQEVTNEATLVLAVGDDEFAELQPGCRLIAKKPGTVNVRARYDGRISNTIRLRIDPIARTFERLELAINTDPIGVGETRNYQVWGYPENGGPRQNLTRLITTDRQHQTRPHMRFNVLEPNSSTNVATHDSPKLIGRNPGKVSLQAAIGDRLVSNREEVSVVGVIRDPIDLRVEPDSITSRVGEMTPPLKVLVRTRGDRRYRELDPELARYVSLDTDTIGPVEDTTGRFTAKRPGNTRIRVSYEGLQTGANVTVVADRFQQVELGLPKFDENTFTVPITVRTDRVAGGLEYRVYRPGDELPAERGWQDTTAQNDQQFVKLTSPQFNLVENNLFRVVIEARDKRSKVIDRYPYAFRLEAKN